MSLHKSSKHDDQYVPHLNSYNDLMLAIVSILHQKRKSQNCDWQKLKGDMKLTWYPWGLECMKHHESKRHQTTSSFLETQQKRSKYNPSQESGCGLPPLRHPILHLQPHQGDPHQALAAASYRTILKNSSPHSTPASLWHHSSHKTQQVSKLLHTPVHCMLET